MTHQHIHIADIEVVRPSGVTETLCASDAPLRPFAHTDPDRPNAVYRARIVGLPSWQTDLYADPSRLAGSVGGGSLMLASADGALAYLRGCLVGRIVIRRGWEGLPWGQWEVLVAATGEAPRWTVSDRSPTRMEIPLWDARALLDRDVQTATYGGTNVGPAGLDGEYGLAGRVKPLLLGDMSTGFVPAVWANGPGRIAQLSAVGISALTGIYDRGGDTSIAVAGDYPGALPSATLTSVQAGTDRAAGLVRLGGATGGDVQFGAIGPAAAGTTGPAIAAWLLTRAGVAGAEAGATLTGLVAPAPCGLYLGDKAAYRPQVERLARSWGGWLVPDRLGVWQAGALSEPAAPVTTITDNDIVQLEVDDADAMLPVKSVAVTWGEVATTLTRDALVPSARETPREAWIKEQTRTAKATDPRVADRRDARELVVDTALRAETPAQALAARLLSVLGLRADGEPRMSLRVAVEATSARLAVPLGASVQLVYPSEGIDRAMALMGYRLWSPQPHLMWWRLFG